MDASEPAGTKGPPVSVGCSDGSREGFRTLASWPDIAGCAGAFDQPGILRESADRRTCGSMAGDESGNTAGTGCSAADLCASGWHVCRGPADVDLHSRGGGCEGCIPAREPRFFVAAGGASTTGICTGDVHASNDLHGCGGLGEPEDESCTPLLRRMGFADCLRTFGVWSCGDSADSLQEARVVSKTATTMGGVLCCRGD